MSDEYPLRTLAHRRVRWYATTAYIGMGAAAWIAGMAFIANDVPVLAASLAALLAATVGLKTVDSRAREVHRE